MLVEDLACAELVEIVTDYLEGALDPRDHLRFEQHLLACAGCVNYLDQMHTAIELTGRLREQDIAPEALAALLQAFRGWHRA